jgi:REP element-mobilizing transposase RayT
MLDSYCKREKVALFKLTMRECRRQLGLGLKEHRGWGGRRAGAGRKPGLDRRVPHGRRDGVVARFPAHVTVKLLPGLPSLRSVSLVRALERSFTVVRERGDFRLVHYSLQTTHVHLLVEAIDSRALARGMMAVGSRLARALNRTSGRRGRVLAERFHARMLRTPREVRNALAYVLLNARRHARGLWGGLRVDPASSGRWFDGWRRQPLVDSARANVMPVARARTWLLATGWRQHGLIDPEEVPGGRRDRRRFHTGNS